MWGSSYLLFWFWRHSVFRLEPTCQQNKSQIPDPHSGTNGIYIAAEPCSAKICGKSTSEMLSQVRFFTGCCFAELLQAQSWALPQFHNSGRNVLHPALIVAIHLSYIFLESNSSQKKLSGTLATHSVPFEKGCSMQNSSDLTNRGQRGGIYLTERKKYKAEPHLRQIVSLRAKNHRAI